MVWAIGANLFYCLGPVADATMNRAWGAQYAAVGATFFRYGFVFAVGLTLLPVPLAFVGWVVRVLGVPW